MLEEASAPFEVRLVDFQLGERFSAAG